MDTFGPYHPWEVSEKKFPVSGSLNSKANFLIRYAILAPSSHNTQPWKFSVYDSTIKVFPDMGRIPLISDRTRRETHISLGCAVANIEIAATYFHLSTKTTFLPEDDLNCPVASLVLQRSRVENKSISKLFHFIATRRTNRYPHKKKVISKSKMKKIGAVNDDDKIRVIMISDKRKIRKIANVVKGATEFAFSNPLFKRELSEWIRSVYTKKHDGIPVFDVGIPKPLSIFAPYLIKYMPSTVQARMDYKLVNTSNSLLVLTSVEDLALYWLRAGRVYQYLSLVCATMGLVNAPMAGIIEHNESNIKLQTLLKTKNRPLFFARVGYPLKETQHSPRRGVDYLHI